MTEYSMSKEILISLITVCLLAIDKVCNQLKLPSKANFTKNIIDSEVLYIYVCKIAVNIIIYNENKDGDIVLT